MPVPFVSPLRSAMWIGAALIAASLPAHAADDDQIVPDRPDFVESSVAVGKGRFQLETSFAAERDHSDGVRERAIFTPTLLRYGLSDTVELRLETDGWTRQHTSIDNPPASQRTSGMADSSLGVKWHVQDAAGAVPSMAVLVHADLPSGGSELRGHGVRPSLRLSAEWDLPDDFSIGVMPGFASQTTDDGRRFTSAMFGVSLGKDWNERWHSFIEVATPQIAHARDGGTQAILDFGAAYLVNKRCQVDTALTRGLNRHTADLGFTVGVSVKY